MNQLVRFDVLIVYNQSMASSASSLSALLPFKADNISYNAVYGYFLKKCHQLKITAAFTTSADIIGPGRCRSFWQYTNNHWSKVNSVCFSTLIFAKFSPKSKNAKSRRQLLFSAKNIKPFTDIKLFNTFFDKQLTYEKLSDYSIPTISLENRSLESINSACQALAKIILNHSNSTDFGSDLIMKDRFGAGGRHVYKFKTGQSENMLAIIRKHSHISFIIQPFISSSSAPTDIRLIYLKNKIVQTYIRVAKPGEYRCNEHQGGLLTYKTLEQISPSIVIKSNKITKIINNQSSLYSLDFMISSQGNIYLLEGNTGPGLDWNESIKKNEIEAKKLIRLVAKELSCRTIFHQKVKSLYN